MKSNEIRKVNDIQGTLHVDAYLTTFSEMFVLDPSVFISPVAATNIPVLKASDLYVRYPRGYFWRDDAEVRALGGRPVQVGYKVESGSYNAEEWALEHTVDDRQRANTDAPIRLDENATTLLTQKQLIRSDRQWATEFFTTGVWTTDLVGGADFLLWGDANSTPIQDIKRYRNLMMQTTGMMPNTLILGNQTEAVLADHPDIVDRIKYTQLGIVTNQLLASLFGVANVRTANSVYNTAVEGATDDIRFIVDPESAWLGYIAPSGGLDTPTAIARFAWTGLVPGAMNQFGGVMMRGRDDRAYTDWFHNRTAYDFAQVSADLGMFFSNAVSSAST